MAALHFGTRRTCRCSCRVAPARPREEKLAKRCWFWLRCEVCYSFLHSQHVCAGARLGYASPNLPLSHPLSLPTSRTLAHSLKISFSLVFRLFGIRFGFSSVDFMNLTLFGCGSLCRRQATGGAECLRHEGGVAGSKSRGQHLANSRRRPQSCRLCNIAGQILVNKQSYSNNYSKWLLRCCSTRKYATKMRPANAQHGRVY